MAQYHRGIWQSDYYARSPLYAFLRPISSYFSKFDQWPALSDYQQFLDDLPVPITNLQGVPIRCVEQDFSPQNFHDHYAPRIFTRGELQTRRENWHDFFQLLTWALFPHTKARINALHYPLAQKRFSQPNARHTRTPLENTLSQFDETGALIVSDNEHLLDLVRQFKWQELFESRRNELETGLRCFVFGHGLLEKALDPFIGMTAKSILLPVETGFFRLSPEQQLEHTDRSLAMLFDSAQRPASPKMLHPFPLLGMPGWWPNQDAAFYDNLDYFRPGRRADMANVS